MKNTVLFHIKSIKPIPSLVLVLSFLFISSSVVAQPVYEWAKSIYHAQGNQEIAHDAYGNVYLAGSFGSSANFDPGNPINTGERNYYFAKYDPSGNYIFADVIPVPDPSVIHLAVDPTGDIYLTGLLAVAGSPQTVDFDPGFGIAELTTQDGAIFIAKYDSAGNYLWAFAIDSISDYGIWPTDFYKHFVVDKYGSCYLTGYFQGSVDFDPSPNEARLTSDSLDAFIVKYDKDGNYLWANKAGGKGWDGGAAISLDRSQNVIIKGWLDGGAVFDPHSEGGRILDTNYQTFFAKYTSDGKFVWVKTVRGFRMTYDAPISFDSAGDFYAVILFDSTIDVDAGPGTSYFNGWGFSLLKYSKDGNYLWSKNIGKTTRVFAIETDASNNVYIGGHLEGKIDLGAGGTFDSVKANNQHGDMFIAKYNSEGMYQWAMHCGSFDTVAFNSGAYIHSLALDDAGNIFASGYFGGITDFDPSSGVANLNAYFSRDIFFAKYSQVRSDVQIKPEELSSAISLYPNPTSGVIHLDVQNPNSEKNEVRIYNVLGAEVLRQEFSPSDVSLLVEVSKLTAGVYTAEIISGDQRKNIQFIKE